MLWLGDRRGLLTDWTTQRWVATTGRRIDFAATPWLRGPAGSTRGIGPEYFRHYAASEGLEIRGGGVRGLMPDFDALASDHFDPASIRSEVVDFYRRTSEFGMEVWSEWCGAFRPVGGLLAALFSRRLQQLNLPLSPLDASRGVTSEVVPLVDPTDGRLVDTAWLRRLSGTGNVLYAAVYSTGRVPGYEGPCVRVVFPLPNGNAIVFLRPESGPKGELVLISGGRGFGDAGFYFTVHDATAPDGAGLAT